MCHFIIREKLTENEMKLTCSRIETEISSQNLNVVHNLLFYTGGNKIIRDRFGSLVLPGLQQRMMALRHLRLEFVKVFLIGFFFINTVVTTALLICGF